MRLITRVASSFAAMSLLACVSAHADTLAYWNFDNGTAPAQVPHATADGIFDGTTPDLSGHNNSLSTWNAGGAGFAYRADHPVLPGNPTNTSSIQNTGGGPAAFNIDRNGLGQTGSNAPTSLTTGQFAAWTVEASWKPETGGNRTVVGRDARDVVTGTGALSALYLKLNPDNSLAISFADVGGVFHTAQTAAGFGDPYDFNYPDDNVGATGKWMNIAATSDGTTLKLFVEGIQVASTNLAGTSTDTRLATGAETDTGNDWYSGGWSVGRGLFNGGHTDRAYGFIDEVRISDSALIQSQFLAPEPATLASLGVAGTLLRPPSPRLIAAV